MADMFKLTTMQFLFLSLIIFFAGIGLMLYSASQKNFSDLFQAISGISIFMSLIFGIKTGKNFAYLFHDKKVIQEYSQKKDWGIFEMFGKDTISFFIGIPVSLSLLFLVISFGINIVFKISGTSELFFGWILTIFGSYMLFTYNAETKYPNTALSSAGKNTFKAIEVGDKVRNVVENISQSKGFLSNRPLPKPQIPIIQTEKEKTTNPISQISEVSNLPQKNENIEKTIKAKTPKRKKKVVKKTNKKKSKKSK